MRSPRRMRGSFRRDRPLTRPRFARSPSPTRGEGRTIAATLRRTRQSARNRPTAKDREIRFMTDAPYISPLDQARILSEALPHMQQYDEGTIVIKYPVHATRAPPPPTTFAPAHLPF